ELMCGGPDLVDTILWIVGGGDLFEKNRTALETAVTQHTQRLYFDENGRVVIPKKFRDHAQLSGEIQVAGRGAYFSLREKAVIDPLTAVLGLLSDEEKDILRARALPSTLGSKDLRGQS
ncbi:MAG: division/cell wall cluster transcriptional repressor MraZ, partial [Pseudomonadota bacterium]